MGSGSNDTWAIARTTVVIPLSKLHLTMPEEHALDIGPVVRVVMTVAERANPESQRTDGKGRDILTAPVGRWRVLRR